MIDTDKYIGHKLAKGRVGSDYNIYDRKGNIIFDADDVGSNMATLNLLADAPLILEAYKRLREENETLRKMDWEYECLWTWLAENTNLLNTIEPLMEEWKKEYDGE